MNVMMGDLSTAELQHRSANDLQMIVGLIELTRRNLEDEAARATLGELGNRVRILASARAASMRPGLRNVSAVVRGVCEALEAMAAPRNIRILPSLDRDPPILSDGAITATAVVANELVTNALKHAFANRAEGSVNVRLYASPNIGVRLTVEDDGCPFAAVDDAGKARSGMGLDLARRLVDQQGGTFIAPENGSKRYEIRMPSRSLTPRTH